MSRSEPTSNDTSSLRVPAFALVDLRYIDRSTPLTCCSIGVATVCSTSRALAPTYVVVTWISGGVISGYCEIGSRESETAPTITVTMERTIATMGRRMKKFPIGHLEAAGGGVG